LNFYGLVTYVVIIGWQQNREGFYVLNQELDIFENFKDTLGMH